MTAKDVSVLQELVKVAWSPSKVERHGAESLELVSVEPRPDAYEARLKLRASGANHYSAPIEFPPDISPEGMLERVDTAVADLIAFAHASEVS